MERQLAKHANDPAIQPNRPGSPSPLFRDGTVLLVLLNFFLPHDFSSRLSKTEIRDSPKKKNLAPINEPGTAPAPALPPRSPSLVRAQLRSEWASRNTAVVPWGYVPNYITNDTACQEMPCIPSNVPSTRRWYDPNRHGFYTVPPDPSSPERYDQTDKSGFRAHVQWLRCSWNDSQLVTIPRCTISA
ncbi:hypothetical protein IFR05_009641 [Cadophora sp. M221]|nr:hypothetical protein IFR05_009641 [Cadophora sp. M221]